MAISRASNSSIQGGLPKFNDIWDGTTATSAYDSLGAVLVGTATSTVTFSNIPATYTHLQLRWLAQTNRGTHGFDDLLVKFDSSILYSGHYLFGNGTSVSASDLGASQSSINVINSAGSTTGGSWWGTAVIDILDYSNTSKSKVLRIINGVDFNNAPPSSLNGRVNFASGVYMSNNAINTITITSNSSSSFQTNSSFALYGIK